MNKNNLRSRKHLNKKQKIITVMDVKATNIIIAQTHTPQKEKRLKPLVGKQFCKCLTEIS